MVRSMTGFGRIAHTVGDMTIHIEIKTLNSKYTDVNLRLPHQLQVYEPTLRQQCVQALGRGKIECTITLDGVVAPTQRINTDLVKAYVDQLRPLTNELKIQSDLIGHILRIPDVITPEETEIDEATQTAVKTALAEALTAVNSFRLREGAALEADFRSHILIIMDHLESIKQYDPERKALIRKRLEEQLEEWVGADKVDGNRFEEELIYYIEKLDINEEKVRLKTHCDYFLVMLEEEDWQKGKKLNFLSQEIGREINTIGSKAQHAIIQQLVVQMKDHLEKIKEQVLNVV